MKHLVKLSLTLLAGAVISACGSSGGESGTKPNNPTKPDNSTTSTDSNVPANLANSTGAVYVISDQDENKKVVRKELSNADNLNVIIVDGKEVQVAFQDKGISTGTWTSLGQVKTCCGSFSSVRFGAVGSNGPDENDYFFYNGKPTLNMPTAGQASYAGHFVVSGDTRHFDDDDYLTGSANLNVDFANKSLNGTLSHSDLKPINIAATVNGNSFGGGASSEDFKTKATVEGKFYGDNAKELGGIFSDKENTWGGAFGAAKQ